MCHKIVGDYAIGGPSSHALSLIKDLADNLA